MRILKYKKYFGKGIHSKFFWETFVIKEIKNAVSWIFVISDVKGQNIAGTFYEKEFQKKIEKEFRIENVIKRKGELLYVKWKCYDNSIAGFMWKP